MKICDTKGFFMHFLRCLRPTQSLVLLCLSWSLGQTVQNPASINFCHDASHQGYRLNSTVKRSLHALSGVDCVLQCVGDICCRSANYRKRPCNTGMENCQLLYTVASERPGDLKQDEEYDYYILLEPQRSFNCSCSLCKNDGMCDAASTKCACPFGFKGRQCQNAETQECTKPAKLEYLTIQNGQITLSSEGNAGVRAANGRLNFRANGKQKGAWRAGTHDQLQWLQVDFRQRVIMTGLMTQGRRNKDEWVESYTMSYSTDGNNFSDYVEGGQKVFQGNSDRATNTTHWLSPPIVAQYIRIHPTTWHRRISMRAELLGCYAVPQTCFDLLTQGATADGEYTVQSAELDGSSLKVHCDMTTDGGGWTVFQKRQDGSVDFFRNWTEYKNGFGSLNGEFWLGLDNIRKLSTLGQNVLRVDLEDFKSNTGHAVYNRFRISSEADKYRITVNDHSGDCGDSLDDHSGKKFSTKDQDNDSEKGENCAARFLSAWWNGECNSSYSNLNGKYHRQDNNNVSDGIYWKTWQGHDHYSLKKTEMKMRPRGM